MTIKRRLLLSNILMVSVPLFAAVVVGVICLQFVSFSMEHGLKPGLHKAEDFPELCKKMNVAVEHVLQEPPATWNRKFNLVDDIFLEEGVAYRISSTDSIIREAGHFPEDIQKLKNAADSIGNEALVSDGNHSLYTHIVSNEYGVFCLLMYGMENRTSYRSVRLVLILCVFFFSIVVLLSVWFTDKFLIAFVFKHIEHPLDILSDGVGELRDGNLSYRISYNGDDEFTSVCAGFNDMAEHLQELIKSVNCQEENRKELVAGISHDLRTPITAINAYVEGLLDGIASTPEKQRKYLTTIKEKAEELERLIEQLFLFSKMELDDFPIHQENCNLGEIVHGVLQSFQSECSKDVCSISENISDANAFIDKELFVRIGRNILENSVKYKVEKTAHISVKTSVTGGFAVVEFCDDGPGVPDDEIDNLFKVFYRCDRARAKTANGSGLGLAIAAKGVERMGGSILASNIMPHGLSITIKLPEAQV